MIKNVDIKEKISNIANGLSTKNLASMPLVDWRPILAKECQVYVYNEGYLAKRFDHINYQFCKKDTAKEILVDNLYALLRFKYFTKTDDTVELRIDEIIKAFCKNLKTSLIRVSFNSDEDCSKIEWLPNGCVAFRNGVYDFRHNNWLFKYDIIKVDKLQNTLYMYDPKYIISWYVNIIFEPLPININEMSLIDFIELMKGLTTEEKNYCFELMYNMSHSFDDKFDYDRFKHLCEILGYLCYQSFCQKFVFFIGSGQNGKNSLLDGCFTERIVPKPASIDLLSIETDKFVTGALENKAHNIYLETTTNDDAYKDNTKLKAITGSQDQCIEYKGQDRYSGIINCKHIWSANDQEKVKFADTTPGFRRRINIFEIWYHWDEQKRFLKKGDYYDTTFSEDLSEIKSNISNIITFIYFAMYGIKSATNNFTKSFNFTENDWQMKYSDIDFELKDVIDSITPLQISKWITSSPNNREIGKSLMYDLSKNRLFESDTLKMFGYMNYEGFIRFLQNDDDNVAYFADHDIYISINLLQYITGVQYKTTTAFTQKFKKVYGITQTIMLNNNKPYVRATFINGKLKIIAR